MLALLAAALLLQDEVDVFYRDGLRFRARDAAWEGYLTGFVRVHARTVLDRPDDEAPQLRTVPDSVFVRNARLETGGVYRRDLAYRFQADFASGTINQETGAAASTTSTKLRDAWLEWRRYPWMSIRFGQFHEPCTGEELSSGRHLEFAERSPLNRLAPGREQGVQVYGVLPGDVLRYYLMASNGGGLVNDDGRSVPDADDEKELSGIVFADLLDGLRMGLGGSITDVDGVRGAEFEQTSPELSVLWLDPTSGTFDGLRRRVDASLRFHHGPGLIRAEALWRDDELEGSPERRLEARGAFATASWLLTGEAKRPDQRVTPEGEWGAFELAFRICRVEFRNAEESGLAGPGDAERLTTLTFAATWWATRFFRLSIDLVHERYSGDLDVDGASVDALTGFLLRAQVDF